MTCSPLRPSSQMYCDINAHRLFVCLDVSAGTPPGFADPKKGVIKE